MKWSEEREPGLDGIPYNHVIAETPLGIIDVSWKGWKERPVYDVMLNGDIWIGGGISLGHAKFIGENYLIEKLNKLEEYLNDEG